MRYRIHSGLFYCCYDHILFLCNMIEVSSHSSLPNHVIATEIKFYYAILMNFMQVYQFYLKDSVCDLCIGKKPTKTEVGQLVNVAERYTLANHLFWGLWGLISSHVNTIDFDYKEYARQRFKQYWLKKPILLNSPSIISQDGVPNGSVAPFTI
ncbi:hypothetical protein Ahy_B05g073775 isoform C [Arachis hypogaea]|uniref:Uncharacterized protein n=1 Tax=Arachis hypogaea TaxID=3818 RepID=A0A444YX24_ARAHY|nr:hypothetical protein Ahy_B05g073775 isoform C [Arachis hypogaea]